MRRLLSKWLLAGGIAALSSGPIPTCAAPPAKAAPTVTTGTQGVTARASALRSRIEKFKEWGGHSMVPSKVVTMNTFQRVRAEVAAPDANALLLLTVDDDYGVRSLASRLLECVIPDAQQRLQAALAAETRPENRSRLSAALTDIAARQAGGTSCHPAEASISGAASAASPPMPQ